MLAPGYHWRMPTSTPPAAPRPAYRHAQASLRGLGELGSGVVNEATGWWRALLFGANLLVTGLSPSAYDARARTVAAQQIRFSAWQVLGGFTLACALLSWVLVRITIRAAAEYGVAEYAQQLVMSVLVLEFVPLAAALFVALRSGAAIATEVALFHVGGELDRLVAEGGDPLRHELMPRVMGTMVAVMTLAFANGALAMAMLYLESYGFSPWGAQEFLRTSGAVFGQAVVFGSVLKTLLFGAAVAAIPISEALAAPRDMRQVPVAVLRAMVRVMLAIALIEGVFLAAIHG
jgi:phospholipid/cholesterol/gamma-HCH transport system permease protein